jgi:hypothetical protein
VSYLDWTGLVLWSCSRGFHPAAAVDGRAGGALRSVLASCSSSECKEESIRGKHAEGRTVSYLDWTGLVLWSCSRGFHPAAAVDGRAGGARTPHSHSAAVPATRYCTGKLGGTP